MSTIPLPLDLVMGALPQGFKGNAQDYAYALVDSLTATVDSTFLVGQVGGSQPTYDLGPWARAGNPAFPNDPSEWWFWDPATGAYQPSDQGTAVGTILMWGGQTNPLNWLICDGTPVSRSVYSRLFEAIGETFGPGDGQTTFNLPPPSCFYLNAPSFVAATGVPITPNYTGQGVNARGGNQATPLITAYMPAMEVALHTPGANQFNQSGTTNLRNYLTSPVETPPQIAWLERVLDMAGQPVGTTAQGGVQIGMPVMPPFVAVNFIIKYQ